MSAKHKAPPAAPEAPETRPASPVVRALTAHVLQSVGTQVNELSLMALADAGLDPADGWRYDPQNAVYRKEVA